MTSLQSNATSDPRGSRASDEGLSSVGAESCDDVLPPVTTFIDELTVVFAFVAVRRTLVVLFGNPANVEIGKLADVAPAGTVTLDGTEAEAGMRVNSETTTPSVPAGAGSVIVPVAVVPAETVDGLTVYDDSVGGGGGVPSGLTSRSAETVTPLPVTKIVTNVGVETADGMICTPARVLPAGTTVAFDRNGSTVELLDLTCRRRSKDAVDETVTVPLGVPGPPPTNSFGTIVKETGVASLPDPDPDSDRTFNPPESKVVGDSGEQAARRPIETESARRFF